MRWRPKRRDDRPTTGTGSVNVGGDNRGSIVTAIFRDPADKERIAHLEQALTQRQNELHDAERRIQDLQRKQEKLELEIERSSGEVRRLDQLLRDKDRTIDLLSTAMADKITISTDIVRLRNELAEARRPRRVRRWRTVMGIIAAVLTISGVGTAITTTLSHVRDRQLDTPYPAVTATRPSGPVKDAFARCVRFAPLVSLQRDLLGVVSIASKDKYGTVFVGTGIRSNYYLRITTTRRNILYFPIDDAVGLVQSDVLENPSWPVFFQLTNQPHDATIKLALVVVDEPTHQRLAAASKTSSASLPPYTRLTTTATNPTATNAESVCDQTTVNWPIITTGD